MPHPLVFSCESGVLGQHRYGPSDYFLKLEDTSNQVEAVQNEIKLYQIETLALKEDTLELTSQALDGALGKTC